MRSKELIEEEELSLRNPQIECLEPNVTVQTGNKSISQQMEDFVRAGRSIQVARADQVIPETPGMPAYPDPIETILLQREIDADLLIARKRLLEDQQRQIEAAGDKAKKNEQELARIKAAAETADRTAQKAPGGPSETA